MCILCSDYIKTKLTIKERLQAGKELVSTANDEEFEHIIEVLTDLRLEQKERALKVVEDE